MLFYTKPLIDVVFECSCNFFHRGCRDKKCWLSDRVLGGKIFGISFRMVCNVCIKDIDEFEYKLRAFYNFAKSQGKKVSKKLSQCRNSTFQCENLYLINSIFNRTFTKLKRITIKIELNISMYSK